MNSVRSLVPLPFFLSVLLIASAAFGQTTTAPVAPTGKTPIIIIPGLTGSELVNGRTGEEVWFKRRRAKDDDLRLPISPNLARNKDALVTRDVIRSVQFFKFLPETEIYERLVEALQTRGGYREVKWATATRRDGEDTFLVFPYDWRRDNVENARLLIRRIETLKRRIGKPDLKFNVIAHSMGGLIARYAAMYGNADLPMGAPRPTWAGARHFDKIFLVGTPNEGSVLALDSLLNGFSYIGGGLNLPFIQDIDRFDVFTIPSIYQLLPPNGAMLAYDENLKPVSVDLYDPATWDRYNWVIWKDEAFTKKFDGVEQRNARPFFAAVLARARSFQLALSAEGGKPPVSFFLIGSDCKETPAAFLLIRDEKKGRWQTRFKVEGFTRLDGHKVKDEEVRPLLTALGDRVVTKRSLDAVARNLGVPLGGELYQCVEHNKLVTSPEVQDKLFGFLHSTTVAHTSP